jgi:hypothetical protein
MESDQYSKGCTGAPLSAFHPRLLEPLAAPGRVLSWGESITIEAPPNVPDLPLAFEAKAVFLLFWAPPN